MSALSLPRIVCAANKHPTSGEIAMGVRHFCPMMMQNIEHMCKTQGANMMDMGNPYSDDWRASEQGFIDQHGVFYSREDAWKIAEANGQIIQDVGSGAPVLYSENLY